MVDINCFNDQGETKLIQSVQKNNYDMVKMLIENNANTKLRSIPSNFTAAMLSDDVEIIKLLIDSVDEVDDDGNSILHYFAIDQDYKAIEILIKNGASYDIKNEEGNTAKDICNKPEIFTDFEYGSMFLETREINFAKMLLEEKKVNINYVNKDNETKLFQAVRFNDVKMVQFLVDNGINQFIRNIYGMVAVNSIHIDIKIVRILKDSVNEQDNKGNTMLHRNIDRGCTFVKKVIELGAKYDIVNLEGKTAKDLYDVFPVTNETRTQLINRLLDEM
jgi:ankyrin repeat protein